MEIKTKEELFQVIKDLQAKISEQSERLDSMKPLKEETPERSDDVEKDKEEEEPERTEEEIDEIEKMLSE